MQIQKIIDGSLKVVDLKNINDQPGPYCMSFGFNLSLLAQSIERVGLIDRPLMAEDKHGRLTVITGYRRILALRSLGWITIPCRIIGGSELSPLECLCLNLYDNLATRNLNEVEKGMVLSRLTLWVPRSEIMDHYMPLLGLPSHEPTLNLFTMLERELNKDVKEHLVQGILSMQSVKSLLDMKHESRLLVFNLISTLKFNINQQIQLVEYLAELSHIKNTTISDLLGDQAIGRICSDIRMNNPQKAKALLSCLRNMRFPTLVDAERVFKNRISGLGLPEGVRVDAPPYFEQPGYRLQVSFKDGKELKNKIEHLNRIQGIEDLGDPWKEQV
ncbi:MAG: ParB N-terminal domain-containing protein [Thermodesulfobacteriota bacterium]|nr:ParB N-terminal domain-containing protein [Thermodesulfobacteriota bacterium]